MAISPLSTNARLGWMDAVRGTAILLLLIWHASAVPETVGVEMPPVIRAMNAFFLPYRMPVLTLLSGMLLARSMRKPLPQYYAGKFAMILWPYVIWILIAKATFLDIEGMPWWHWRAWYATSYLWFLFFIGVYYLIAPAFRRVPPWTPVVLGVVLGLVLPHGSTEQRIAYFAVFFFVGNWLVLRPRALDRLTSPPVAWALLLPVLGFGVASSIWTDALQYNVLGAPLSIAGAMTLMALAARLPSGPWPTRTLEFFGRSSLVFYVSHYPAMALLSASLATTLHPLLLAAANLALALAIGGALALGKRRIPVVWLFQAPTPLTRAIARMLSLAGRPARPRGTT